jgi:hypothetical protein
MQGDGESERGEWRSDAWWAMLAGKLLHPIQVEIVETFSCVGLPLCVRDLAGVVDDIEPVNLDYHVGRLRNLGALQIARSSQAGKGFMDVYYELTPERILGGRR